MTANDRLQGRVLLIDPDSPSTLFITSPDGIYRSTNGGSAWSLVLSRPGARGGDLVMDPEDPERLYAALSHTTDASAAGVYETNDGGDNWSLTSDCPGGRLPDDDSGQTIRLAISGSRVYVSYRQGGTRWRLFRTTEFGCSVGGQIGRLWEKGREFTEDDKVGNATIAGRLWSFLHTDPTDPQHVYATGTDFWISHDDGDSFSRATGPHVDHHAFAVDPTDPETIYTASDGGLYRSRNRGDSWDFVADGMTIVEFYDIANAATEPGLVIGGTQDNGTIRFDGSGPVWEHIRGGDGATVAIDPTDAGVLYSMGQYAASIRRKRGTGGWDCISCGLPTGSTCFNLHYQPHPAEPETLLASCQSLRRAVDPECDECPDGDDAASPNVWSTILTVADNSVVRSAVDPTVDLYYAGTNLGQIHAGPGGSGFQQVFSNAPNKVTDIEVDPHDPEIVYVAFAGMGAGRIHRLRRTSPRPSSMSSTDITSDLPAGVAVRTIAVDRMRLNTLYAGTNGQGVFRGRSFDGGTTWTWAPYNNGLPAAADVRDLEIHPTTGAMRAATFGRSAYEVNTDFPIGSLLAVEGRLSFLRVHDVGTGFGPPQDPIDAEVIVQLAGLPRPTKSFGFQLRTDANEAERRGMLDLLRDAFRYDRPIRIEYLRTGIRTGLIIRVIRKD